MTGIADGGADGFSGFDHDGPGGQPRRGAAGAWGIGFRSLGVRRRRLGGIQRPYRHRSRTYELLAGRRRKVSRGQFGFLARGDGIYGERERGWGGERG